jgi:hypothetical protein
MKKKNEPHAYEWIHDGEGGKHRWLENKSKV